MSNIHHTQNHELFKFIIPNRSISQKHVDKLAKDETFKENFKFHPIIVNQEYGIIDGQHRYLAARQLGIPIHYIIQNNGSLETIKQCNVQQKKWDSIDYLKFFAYQKMTEYEFIKNCRERFEYPLYLINAICRKFEGLSKTEWGKYFKEGSLKIHKKAEIIEFLEIFVPKMKELRKNHKEDVRHLTTEVYTQAFVDTYVDNKPIFDKLIYRIDVTLKILLGTDSVPEAREMIIKASKKTYQ
jgi:hypothetical protein